MDRSRWMPAPVADNQDTDPNDVAEMAMSELSGVNTAPSPDGEYDMAGETGSFSNTSELSPAPPQGTISGQYMQAPRLPKDGPRVSIQLLFLVTVSALAVGVLIGFICGYLMSR